MRTVLVLSLVGLAIGGGPCRVDAITLDVYGLDSLAFMSSDVVEAEAVRFYEKGGLDLADVQVLKVHKGEKMEGGTVTVAALIFYRKPKPGDLNPEPLAAGDRLVLFLVPAREGIAFPVPKGADIGMPVPSGVRLLRAGRLVGFRQQMNPGPYVADAGDGRAGDGRPGPPTLARFREELAAAIRTAAEAARELERLRRLEGADAAEGLVEMLRGRAEAGAGPAGRDHIAELACMRLADLHEPRWLAEALPLVGGWHARQVLHRGFGTPSGRDDLLARVNDARAPLAERVRYARILADAGDVYRSTFTDIGANGWRLVGGPGAGNSGYLTRIARAAQAARDHEELCLALVGGLDRFGRGIAWGPNPERRADLKGALTLLKTVYDAGASERLQYAIEKAAANSDREAFDRLQAPGGRFLSILWPVDPARYTRPEDRGLVYEFECNAVLYEKDAVLRPSLVLVHLKSGKMHVLPTDRRLAGGRSVGGSAYAELPADLPAGRYRVFWRLSEGAKVVSIGHHFETDL